MSTMKPVESRPRRGDGDVTAEQAEPVEQTAPAEQAAPRRTRARITREEAPDEQGTVTFVQFDEPALKVDEYTITITQTTNTAAPNRFTSSRTFAVSGERFSFQSGQIDSLFPPELANGEFDGCLPCAVLNRRTLPWERYLDPSNAELPWLAVLTFDGDQAPPVVSATASDLIPLGQPITVLGDGQLTGTGKMPAHVFSYPAMNPLGFGESPDEPCSIIDVDVATYNQIVPSLADMAYLAHIRQVDTVDTVRNTDEETSFAVVLGNRIPPDDVPAQAMLVSLENLGPYLPGDDGAPAQLPAGTERVRLLCYRAWRFTANTLGQNFEKLLEDLNTPLPGAPQLTTLQLPTIHPAPSATDVQTALAAQAQGQLSAENADVLVRNAFAQGYVPMNHEMRHANTSVSFYRGPCAPFAMPATTFVSASSPDAANRYDPQTGLFDVSYGAAWQLGQLMALQNQSYANALFNWKKSVNAATAAAAEQQILEAALGIATGGGDGDAREVSSGALAQRRGVPLGFVLARRRLFDSQPPLPDEVAAWLGQLKLLHDVPFSYLVPDERMLPPESLRFFSLDRLWIDHLVDGAFSIGRTCTSQRKTDARLITHVHERARPALFSRRRRRKRRSYLDNPEQQYTGFFLRSAVVAGWPNLQVNGYATVDDSSSELGALRLERLAPDCLFCIFDGALAQLAIHEPSEQLHCGIELDTQPYSTTLRAVTGPTPGAQFLTDPHGGLPVASIPMRADSQTLQVAAAAASVLAKLNTDFDQGITRFTSAELALELIKGVVKVNFNVTPQGGS